MKTQEDTGLQTDSSDEDGISRGDAAFNKGAIKGIGLALKEAPKKFIEGFADLLLNPVSTVEGIIGFLENLPEMPGHIFAYLETIEGDEEAKGEEIAKFITEQLLTFASPNKAKLLQQVSKTKLGLAAVKVGQKGVIAGFRIEGQLAQIFENKKLFPNWLKGNQSLSRVGRPLTAIEAQQIIDNAQKLGLTIENNLKGMQGLEKTGQWANIPHFKVENVHIPIVKGLDELLKF